MQDCWQENPENRPDFTTLRESLETMMQKDNPYLDLTAVDESRAYYNVPSFNSVTEESADDECDSDVEMFVLGSVHKQCEFALFLDLRFSFLVSPKTKKEKRSLGLWNRNLSVNLGFLFP